MMRMKLEIFRYQNNFVPHELGQLWKMTRTSALMVPSYRKVAYSADTRICLHSFFLAPIVDLVEIQGMFQRNVVEWAIVICIWDQIFRELEASIP